MSDEIIKDILVSLQKFDAAAWLKEKLKKDRVRIVKLEDNKYHLKQKVERLEAVIQEIINPDKHPAYLDYQDAIDICYEYLEETTNEQKT